MANAVTKNNFEEFVLKSDLPVLVDFWAPWCGPCKMVGPIIDQIAEEYEGKIRVAKVNVDEEQELAVEHEVVSIPTILLFNEGKVIKKEIGFKPKNQLEDLFKGLI